MKKVGILKATAKKFKLMFEEYERSIAYIAIVEEQLEDKVIQIHCPINRITEYSKDGVTVDRTVNQEYPSSHICNTHMNDEYLKIASNYVFVDSLDDIELSWEEPLTEV